MESLWSSLQDEVYFMNGGVAARLWRHQTWSPSWILYTSFNFFSYKKFKKHALLLKNGLTTCYFWRHFS